MATTYQLYLGRNIPQVPEALAYVNDIDFADFLTTTVKRYFENWTITNSVSSWKGIPEDVYVLTIISDDYEAALFVRAIAKAYKDSFSQEAVLINSFRSDSLLIE